MLQLKIRNYNAGIIYNNLVYLDLYDKWITSDPDTKWLLCELTSQFTDKTVYFLPTGVWTYKDRYVQLSIRTTRGLPAPSVTVVELGTTELPLGFYDITIYQNTDNANLDPTGLTTIYEGLMNLSIISGATEPVVYTEYTTNDADTESIYITNTAV
jgi:hypothetical protein